MHAHRIVCGDWAVQERPRFPSRRLRAKALKGAIGTPARQHLVLQADEVGL